eukprot:673326_1
MAYIEREVERSVPELKAFNLLSQREIRQIIKERTYFADRKFKYSKHDFLRYIQFENKLFRLVLLRTQSRKDLNKNDIISIRKRFISRINYIYNIALNRYSSDKQLWLLSFDFAKRYSERISRAKFLKALLLHPHWIDAWIEAAKYEYEWNKNPSNARLLFQRAISLNKKSVSLYLSFFKMEMMVIKQHLNWNYNETAASFDWKKELKEGKKGNDEWLERVYSEMEVPKLILRYALQNIEEKGAKHVLIKRLLLLIPGRVTHDDDDDDKSIAIAKRFDELRSYVFEYLEKHYYFDCVMIQLLARKNVQIYSHNNTVMSRAVEISGCQVFERAMMLLSSLPGDKVEILTKYVEYVQNRLDLYVNLKQTIVTKEERSANDLYLLAIYDDVTQYLALRLVDSFAKLRDLSGTNAPLVCKWALTLTQMNALDEAFELIESATKQYPQSVELWQLYADLYQRQLAVCSDETNYRKAIAICGRGIECVSATDAPKLWLNVIDIMMAQWTHVSLNGDGEMTKQIEDTFRRAIEECLSHNDELKESYLRWIVCFDECKILNALQWFDHHTMKCSPTIYKQIFDIYESILLFDGDHRTNIERIARLYEKCLNQHGKTEAQVWIWYLQYAQKYMKLSQASSIYQRAIKTLSSEGVQLFVKHANGRHNRTY